ncbi:hypothetical protein V6N11_019267 [Hibiscus sabdariffa]|uniref:Integrase catalytic domain-containing protein n=1 Tax=Hibiscus sabdariffa TaxID=183260 RepID=A0ABR2R2P1_9ROSI
MGLFVSSFGNTYIILAVDYVSKWVEAKATRNNDARTTVNFLKNYVFSRFGTPKAIISDRGTHFLNRIIDALMKKHDVTHRVAMAYHPLSNGQAEVSNRKLRSKWLCPYTVTKVFPHGAVEVEKDLGERFKVNGQRLKPYYENAPIRLVEEIHLENPVL